MECTITKDSWDIIADNLFHICAVMYRDNYDEAKEAMLEEMENQGILKIVK